MIFAGSFLQLLVSKLERDATFGSRGPKPSSPLSDLNLQARSSPTRWIKAYHITKKGKLVHTSRTKVHALREVAWRDWVDGEDGVEIRETFVKGETEWGLTDNPHRFGGRWPPAKEAEFAKLYQEGMAVRDLEEYFDAAISMLGRKRQQLGIAKRR